ncbi:MAG: type II secretion system protein GspF [Desulfobacteraceae bacterium]|nr:type II secretion system F family protein [Desulfobacteraceae bacterium]MBC2754929.1 type II secretion system protein GspF [Desulfobacteraceae bacterium]
MPIFSYKASDAAGKVFKGTLEAAEEKEVAAKLQAMNYIPIRIQAAAGRQSRFQLDGSINISSMFQRVTSKDVMMFTLDLHALLQAGLPVDKALSILINVAEKEKFKEVVAAILKNVQSGNSLSEALAKYPNIFPMLYTNMVKAGETGGVLPVVLDRLGSFLENSQDLKDYIKSAMVYPLFLVFVGGISIIIMLAFVVPKFAIIFSDLGQAMPFSTQLLLGISHGLRDYWWMIIAGVGAIIYLLKKYVQTPEGRLKTDRMKVNLPVIGTLVKSVEAARFTRTLGTLINSGVPILQALRLVQEIITNQLIAGALEMVYNRVKEGDNLSAPLLQADIFPPLAVQMISVGEETGKLDQMLLRVAENYEKVVRNMIKRFVNLLEPVMILAMGLMVGFIVISMLMAVFSMNEVPF